MSDEMELVKKLNLKEMIVDVCNFKTYKGIGPGREERPSNFIYNLYLKGEGSFKEGLRTAITEVINELTFEEMDNNADSFFEYLDLVYLLQLEGVYDKFSELIKNSYFKNTKTSFNKDLHFYLLRAFFRIWFSKAKKTVEEEKDIRIIINRDINQSLYAGLCFRTAWEISFDFGFNLLNKYFNTLRKENNEHFIKSNIERFLEALGMENISEYIPEILTHLSKENIDLFETILKEIIEKK
jgi:hypothetical protein